MCLDNMRNRYYLRQIVGGNTKTDISKEKIKGTQEILDLESNKN